MTEALQRHGSNAADDRDLRWLAAGALAGLIAAGIGMLRQAPSPGHLPDGAIARVNDQTISRARFDGERQRLADPADDAWLLQQLVDEELLVQRGVALGMTHSDRTVRNAIVTALVASITAEADAANPGDEELRSYFNDNAERFSYVARLAIDAWIGDEQAAAQDLAASLQRGDVVPAESPLRPMPGLSPALLSIERIADVVGPGIAAAAADMPEGSSAVFARRGRWLVVRVRQKEMAVETDLSAIRNRVLIDYRRHLADAALGAYLDELRDRASITVARP